MKGEAGVGGSGAAIEPIVADDREVGVISELRALGLGDDRLAVRRLEVGDFLLPGGFVVERKTVEDLRASVIDGRMPDQRARLCGSTGSGWCYLIEGRLAWGSESGDIPVAAASKAVTVDHVTLLTSRDAAETARILASLAASLRRTGGRPREFEGYASVSAASKRGNVDPAVAYQRMLMAVPGVSAAVARAVAGVYPTMRDLVRAAGTGAAQKAIADARAGQAEGARRVGPAVAERLVAALAGEAPEEPRSKRRRKCE